MRLLESESESEGGGRGKAKPEDGKEQEGYSSRINQKIMEQFQMLKLHIWYSESILYGLLELLGMSGPLT